MKIPFKKVPSHKNNTIKVALKEVTDLPSTEIK